MILVTHEMQFAQAIADRIIFLDQGKIAEEGTAQDFFTKPKTKRTQEFLNALTLANLAHIYKGDSYETIQTTLNCFGTCLRLIFVTACSSGGNAGSSSGKTTAKARTIDEIKKRTVSYESPYLEIRNRLVTLTMMVLTKVTISNLGTNWLKTLVSRLNTFQSTLPTVLNT